MTNFGEHYNEELTQQEIEINKKTLWEMVGAFIVLTAVWGLAFGRFPTANAIVFSVTYAISTGFFIASVILFFKADPSDERMKKFFCDRHLHNFSSNEPYVQLPYGSGVCVPTHRGSSV